MTSTFILCHCLCPTKSLLLFDLQSEHGSQPHQSDPGRASFSGHGIWTLSHIQTYSIQLFPKCYSFNFVSSPNLTNGTPKYELQAFISHMGTSTLVGHYVCHIKREGSWVIFNDNKVALSEKPPKGLGYLYLYKRKDA